MSKDKNILEKIIDWMDQKLEEKSKDTCCCCEEKE